MYNHIGLKKNILNYVLIFSTTFFLGSCTLKSDLPGKKAHGDQVITQILNISNNSLDKKLTISHIDEIKEIESTTNDPEINRILCGIIAQELSFIGNYKESLYYMDK